MNSISRKRDSGIMRSVETLARDRKVRRAGARKIDNRGLRKHLHGRNGQQPPRPRPNAHAPEMTQHSGRPHAPVTHAACPNATPCNPNKSRLDPIHPLQPRLHRCPNPFLDRTPKLVRTRMSTQRLHRRLDGVGLSRLRTSSSENPQSAATRATAVMAIGLFPEWVSQISSSVLASFPGCPTIHRTGSCAPLRPTPGWCNPAQNQ